MTHETMDYIQALRARGYRVTPQRLIVLDAVCACQGHATLADIQRQVNDMDPTIDRSTIYRALAVLREAGLIVETELGALGRVYRVAGEADHHHLVCLACGAVLTVSHDEFRPLWHHLREVHGFALQADHLVFNGYCRQCQQASD